jgi:NADH-quinone oxidoreductase subunit J
MHHFDMHTTMFCLIASLTGLCAIATVVTQNIVRSATWLLFTLAGTSGIFFLLGADLVGAIQLLVYVGGTMVLVVFGVMLTAQGPFINMKASGAEWAISIVAGLLFVAALCFGLHLSITNYPSGAARATQDPPDTSRNSAVIGMSFLGVGERVHDKPKSAEETPDDKTRRKTFDGVHYLLPFEIVSVHLLVVLIGAAYLARAKRRRADAGGEA